MSDRTVQMGGIMLVDGDQSQDGTKNNSNEDSSGTTNINNKPSSTTASKSSNPSKASIIKDGWGSRSNFQASYGLDMTPEGLVEGDAILRAMQDADKGGRK